MGSDIVEIDVGGVLFKTTVATLKKSPHLRKVLEYEDSGAFGQSSRDDHGRFFLDRNPDMFVHVLKYLRCGKWFVPDSADTAFLSELAAECEYLQIDDMSFLSTVSNLAGGSRGGHGNIDPLFAELRRVILSGHCGGGAITTRSGSAQSHRCLESSRNLSRERTRDADVGVVQEHQSTCVDPSVVFQRLNDCIRESACFCSIPGFGDQLLVGNVVSCMALAILAPEIRSLAEMTTFVESRMHRLSGTLKAKGIDYACYVCFTSSDLGGEFARDDCIFVVLEVGRLTISILGWRPK